MLYVILKLLTLVVSVFVTGILGKIYVVFLEPYIDDVSLYILSLLILPFCSFTMVVIRQHVFMIILIVIITTELWICEVYFQLVDNLEHNKKIWDLLGLLKNSMCLWLSPICQWYSNIGIEKTAIIIIIIIIIICVFRLWSSALWHCSSVGHYKHFGVTFPSSEWKWVRLGVNKLYRNGQGWWWGRGPLETKNRKGPNRDLSKGTQL
jgi:hypothetical protein